MQKGISYIIKIIKQYKDNQLDYLTCCNYTRKIYHVFDFDGDNNLDKVELNATLDAFIN